MNMTRLLLKTYEALCLEALFALDHSNAIRSGENNRLHEPDEQPVLDHTRNGRQRQGKPFGIGNCAHRGVEYPVTAVRDENVAVFAFAQRHCARSVTRDAAGLEGLFDLVL